MCPAATSEHLRGLEQSPAQPGSRRLRVSSTLETALVTVEIQGPLRVYPLFEEFEELIVAENLSPICDATALELVKPEEIRAETDFQQLSSPSGPSLVGGVEAGSSPSPRLHLRSTSFTIKTQPGDELVDLRYKLVWTPKHARQAPIRTLEHPLWDKLLNSLLMFYLILFKLINNTYSYVCSPTLQLLEEEDITNEKESGEDNGGEVSPFQKEPIAEIESTPHDTRPPSSQDGPTYPSCGRAICQNRISALHESLVELEFRQGDDNEFKKQLEQRVEQNFKGRERERQELLDEIKIAAAEIQRMKTQRNEQKRLTNEITGKRNELQDKVREQEQTIQQKELQRAAQEHLVAERTNERDASRKTLQEQEETIRQQGHAIQLKDIELRLVAEFQSEFGQSRNAKKSKQGKGSSRH